MCRIEEVCARRVAAKCVQNIKCLPKLRAGDVHMCAVLLEKLCDGGREIAVEWLMPEWCF